MFQKEEEQIFSFQFPHTINTYYGSNNKFLMKPVNFI